MDRIKRTDRGVTKRHPFLRALLITILCAIMVALGFFGAEYFYDFFRF